VAGWLRLVSCQLPVAALPSLHATCCDTVKMGVFVAGANNIFCAFVCLLCSSLASFNFKKEKEKRPDGLKVGGLQLK